MGEGGGGRKKDRERDLVYSCITIITQCTQNKSTQDNKKLYTQILKDLLTKQQNSNHNADQNESPHLRENTEQRLEVKTNTGNSKGGV